ncbi:MAG: hypothetical protein KA436_00155 [Oligoflexales bacterium]|nr:hypothetical protein [Oligoflexales bacterium]
MTYAEILSSLEIGLIYGVVALGIYLTFRVIDFSDLSCDGSFVSGAAASAVTLKMGWHPAFALLSSLLAGGFAGLLTSLLHLRFRISPLLSGILTAFMLYSLNLRLMGGVPNITLLDEINIFHFGKPLFILMAISALICLGVSFLLVTDFGLALRSLAHNRDLAMVGGVRLSSYTLVGLVLSNILIGLGGGLFSQHQGFVDVSQGTGTLIIGLAALMIGEKILPFRSIWLACFACFAGSILYRFALAFALHSDWLGLESADLNLLTGLILILIMCLPRLEGAKG